MKIDVAFHPGEVQRPGNAICIVVDVVRASTTMVTLFEAGCSRIYVAADVPTARRCAEQIHALLCGERNGLKVPGFDYGNSPLEFSTLDLRGREAVLATTNGTVAVHAVRAAPGVLVGCLRNATAVVGRALEMAGPAGHGITVVCAGRDGGFVLDDAFCAGYLVSLLRQDGDPSLFDLTDAAMAAEHIAMAYDDTSSPLRASSSGRALERIGLAADLPFVAEVDRSKIVPELIRPACASTFPVYLVGQEVGRATTEQNR